MGYDRDFLLGEAPQLVEVAEGVQERVGPRVAAARRVRGLGVPERLAGFELVPDSTIEGEGFVGARQPLFR